MTPVANDAADERQAAQVAAGENVRVERYDLAAIRDRFPAWDDWPRQARHDYLRGAAPDGVSWSSNVTTTALHEYLAAVLTLTAADADALAPPTELAFGDSAASFSTSDAALNNEVGTRIPITDRSQNGALAEIDEYLSSNELNGNTLREVGVFSADGDLYQHAPLSTAYDKDSGTALLINITIAFADA